jgi:hypothetical protein
VKRAILVLLVVAAAGAYGWLDVRNRARLDRGTKYHRTDFTVYQAAAEALADRTDPYEARSPRGYRYVYPPLLAVLLLPVARWSAPDAALLFFAGSALALAGALALLARVTGRRAALLGALLCAPFLHQSFERGQVTVLLLALQVAALHAAFRRRYFVAAAFLAAGTALRLTPVLPAAALGAGLLAAREWGGLARLLGGFLAGLFLCFVAVPVLALGPARATEVTVRWAERSRELFGGAPGEFEGLDGINEYRFKNQSPRRVLATWTGWAKDAKFEKEKPDLSGRAARAVDLAAYGIAAACGLLALLLGFSRMRAPAPTAFALVLLLPLFMTRYTWPTHYVTALPAVAFAPPRARLLFAAGAAVFYAAHAESLQRYGAAGPLLLGGLLLAAALARSESP